MTPLQETIKILKANGYKFVREGANHTLYMNPDTKITIPVKRHDFDENDKRYILKEARIKI